MPSRHDAGRRNVLDPKQSERLPTMRVSCDGVTVGAARRSTSSGAPLASRFRKPENAELPLPSSKYRLFVTAQK
jgi:hypothetical protein